MTAPAGQRPVRSSWVLVQHFSFNQHDFFVTFQAGYYQALK
jgi:hypothetical protein